jgi:hypothetical protein
MSGRRRIALFVCLTLIGATAAVGGSSAMRMRPSPSVSRAPALVTVQVVIEPATENRYVEIVAASPDFYRSSRIEIDRDHAARLSVFEFRNLPRGLYQVTGVLVGTHGRRAAVSQLAKVEPAIGSE